MPLVGGPIGATIDGLGCRTIATYAMATFTIADVATFSVPVDVARTDASAVELTERIVHTVKWDRTQA